MNNSKQFNAPHSFIKIHSESTEDQLIFAETRMSKTLNPVVQVDISLKTFAQLTSLIDDCYLDQGNTTLAAQWLNQVAGKLGLVEDGDRNDKIQDF